MKEKNREHKHEKTEHRANINSEKRILLREIQKDVMTPTKL